VESADVTIKNPDWTPSLKKFLSILATKLGVNPSYLSAKLDSLLFMERGSEIHWCSNVEEEQSLVGTLLVQLPSAFTGGLFRIYDGEEGQEEDEEESNIASFDLGRVTRDSEFKCHFVCHYNDCQYEMEKIKSGSRVLLRYSLRYNEKQNYATFSVLPSAAVLRSSSVPLQLSLNSLPRTDRVVLIPLAKLYSDTSLSQNGLNALKPAHRAIAEAIKASGTGWEVLIVQAKKICTCIGNGATSCSSSMKIVYNEHGKKDKTSMKWLEQIVSFSPIEEAQVVIRQQLLQDEDSSVYWYMDYSPAELVDNEPQISNRDAMMLTDSKMVQDNWGKHRSLTEIDDYGDEYHHYNHDAVSYHAMYCSTFLIAYDPSSVFEIQCLSPGCSNGVINAIRREIIPTKDFALLDRLLTVVETKKSNAIDHSHFRALLEMMLGTGVESSTRNISLVNRILVSSPAREPNEDIWNAIESLVKKFGWNSIGQSVAVLLNCAERKKGGNLQSRISLRVFIDRFEFAMKLNMHENREVAFFAQQYLSECFTDLHNTDAKVLFASDAISASEKIERIVKQHGWNERFVQNTLGFLIANVRGNGVLNIGNLVFGLHSSHRCLVTWDCLLQYVKKFTAVVSGENLAYTNKEMIVVLLQSIRAVIEYGDQDDINKLGEKSIHEKRGFSFLLNAITETEADDIDSHSLLRDFMNRCLLQHSVPHMQYRWKENDSDVSPCMHIQMCFDKNPNLSSSVDAVGRLPLHHAVASSNEVPCETLEFIAAKYPVAATTRDPVSGLFPFMMAGSVGNVEAAFKLLLEDPGLVTGALVNDIVEENSKKRKRS
jgi:hypothetical protein